MFTKEAIRRESRISVSNVINTRHSALPLPPAVTADLLSDIKPLQSVLGLGI